MLVAVVEETGQAGARLVCAAMRRAGSAACVYLSSLVKSLRDTSRDVTDAGSAATSVQAAGSLSRKEVFQPHLPVRLPCYDLAPVTCLTLGRSFRSRTSGTPGFHGLTGGVYKARERIHRAMADARLLANPASRSRVADSDPN